MLLLLPQRYVFSSKSQRYIPRYSGLKSCCCYHKGTYFQANHNIVVKILVLFLLLLLPQRYVFSSKSQRLSWWYRQRICCCCYHKGTYFQANHNMRMQIILQLVVVVATTKVRIFKQITTYQCYIRTPRLLLLLPQRYVFSSKSQRVVYISKRYGGCCCYHKGTYFQANHNYPQLGYFDRIVVVATTKVRIFKQITTLQVFR